jgi:hypothetical protein
MSKGHISLAKQPTRALTVHPPTGNREETPFPALETLLGRARRLRTALSVVVKGSYMDTKLTGDLEAVEQQIKAIREAKRG